MKQTLSLIILCAVLLVSCSVDNNTSTSFTDTETNSVTESDSGIHVPEIFTATSLVTEFVSSLPSLPDDGVSTEFSSDFCFSETGFFYNHIIPDTAAVADPDIGLYDGVFLMNESGETSRLCPEGCSVDAHCTHLGYERLQLTASGDHVFMLASDINRTSLGNKKVCLLRYTITSGELVKYAEFETWSVDSPKMFLYGGFLFIYSCSSSNTTTVYCFDLAGDKGYRYTDYFSDAKKRKNLLGISDGYIYAYDNEAFYRLDSDFNVTETYEKKRSYTNSISLYGGKLYYCSDKVLYEYDFQAENEKMLLDNCSAYSIHNGEIYYFNYENRNGLKYKVAIPFTNPVQYKIEDYPVYFGYTVNKYSPETGEKTVLYTPSESEYLSGIIRMTENGFWYSYFTESAEPRLDVTENFAFCDFELNKKAVVEFEIQKTVVR